MLSFPCSDNALIYCTIGKCRKYYKETLEQLPHASFAVLASPIGFDIISFMEVLISDENIDIDENVEGMILWKY